MILLTYKWIYKTSDEFDDIVLNSDGEYLTGLCFVNSKDSSKHNINCEEKELPIFKETCNWLDIYFSGKEPNFIPKYKINNSTPFRNMIIELMKNVPFGETTTYGDIAKKVATIKGKTRMSSQAVGGAVGWNPICIIIPCHRVVGSDGNLTGYGGGINNKIALLKLEKNDTEKYSLPNKLK